MRESRRPPLFEREALSLKKDSGLFFVLSNLLCTFADMNRMKGWLVWLGRLHRCRGFGIQSPTDYGFVRYVINEHWPYYAYQRLHGEDWLTRKLGRLYFRLANWRQPTTMCPDRYMAWWKAGCGKVRFEEHPGRLELVRVDITDDVLALLDRCNAASVLVVEGIWRDWARWRSIVDDGRTGICYDLYYCGIVFFDKNRFKHCYKINF